MDTFFHKQLRPALLNLLSISDTDLRGAEHDFLMHLQATREHFYVAGYIKFLADYCQLNQEQVDDAYQVFHNRELYSGSLFPEVITSLRRLKREHKLGIWSQGNPEWQRHKLTMSGILHFFSDDLMFIGPQKLDPEMISSMPVKTSVIDNQLDFLAALPKHLEAQPVWLNRDHNTYDFSGDQVVTLDVLR